MNDVFNDKQLQNLSKKVNCPLDMPQPTQNISLKEVVSGLSRAQREKLVAGRDLMSFARVFEDGEIMSTVNAFLDNAMNISKTARILYMHRNTLSYRLDKIKKLTGLDIKNFDEAITFLILKSLYEIK